MNASSKNFAVAAMLACMASLPSVGAELRPYSLPSHQAAPRVEQRQMEPRAVRPRASEAYYQNFEKKVKGLKTGAARQALPLLRAQPRSGLFGSINRGKPST